MRRFTARRGSARVMLAVSTLSVTAFGSPVRFGDRACDVACLGTNEAERCGADMNGGCDSPGGSSSCCVANGGVGCDNVSCQNIVCGFDQFCCSTAWDGICAGEAESLCGDLCSGDPQFGSIACGETVCGTCWAVAGTRDTDWFEFVLESTSVVTLAGSAEFPFEISILGADGIATCDSVTTLAGANGDDCRSATACATLTAGTWWALIHPASFNDLPCDSGSNEYSLTLQCGIPCGEPNCGLGAEHDCATTGTQYCTDTSCCQLVCNIDPSCCETAWDRACVAEACSNCGIPCTLTVGPDPREFDFVSIAAAVKAASDGSTILVAAGTYAGFDVVDKTISIIGVAGRNSTFIKPIDGPGTGTVILQGWGTKVSGFTFADNSSGIPASALLVMYSADITDCAFRNNVGGFYGGAVWLNSGLDVSFDRCAFEDNKSMGTSADSGGGAIWSAEGTQVFIHECEFRANTASARGGAILTYLGSLTILESSFCENNAAWDGAAIYLKNTTLDMVASVVDSNLNSSAIKAWNRPDIDATLTACLIRCNPEPQLDGQFELEGTSVCSTGCNEVICSLASQSAACGFDCNGNGNFDPGDVISGTSPDVNGNWIPDECECLADINGDSAVNGSDIAFILAAWGTDGGVVPASDITLDGIVDGADLAYVLGAWGACP
jgi:hypothetical protein